MEKQTETQKNRHTTDGGDEYAAYDGGRTETTYQIMVRDLDGNAEWRRIPQAFSSQRLAMQAVARFRVNPGIEAIVQKVTTTWETVA